MVTSGCETYPAIGNRLAENVGSPNMYIHSEGCVMPACHAHAHYSRKVPGISPFRARARAACGYITPRAG